MDWPTRGREGELARLGSMLAAPERRGAVLVGDPGVGKSRLLRELLHGAERAGHPVERVTATASATAIAFGAFARLLPPAPPGVPRSRLLRDLRVALEERAVDGRRLVLAVDDAHALDDASAALLHQLAAGGRVFLALTLRAAEPVPDAITALWKDEALDRIEVRPLDRTVTADLTELALGGPIHPALHADLWRLSGGNPLFLRELLLGALDRGQLNLRGGLWQLTGRLEPSDRLVDLLRTRLDGVPAPVHHALELLAVGEPLRVDLVESLGIASELEHVEERQIAVVEDAAPAPLVRFHHPLHGEVIRAGMPRSRRRRLSRLLADALEARTGDSDDLLRLALWRLEGGGPASAPSLILAARQAAARTDHRLAARLARAALAHAGDAERFEALLLLGDALGYLREIDEARAVLTEAQRIAPGDLERARAAVTLAHTLFFRGPLQAEAIAVLGEAEQAVSRPAARDEIGAALTLFAGMRGDLETAIDRGRGVLARSDEAPAAAVSTLMVSTAAEVMIGRPQSARPTITRALELAQGVAGQVPIAGDLLSSTEVLAIAYAGSIRDSVEQCRARYEDALVRGPDPAAAWAAITAGLLLDAGRARDASRWAAEARTALADHDALGIFPLAVASAATAAAWLGDLDQAAPLVAELGRAVAGREARTRIYSAPAGVWLTAARGDLDAATEQACEAAAFALDHQHLVWGAQLFHIAARLDRPDPVVDPLADIAARAEGRLLPALAAHAAALAARDGEALQGVAEDFAAMGAMLLAAEAQAQSAAAFALRKQHPGAEAAAARAALYAGQCQGARTPALLRLQDGPLTAREHQVALMAAAGMTSPQVARRLVVSTRTVDNHLASIYRKLDVHSRADLARLITPGTATATGESDEALATV